MAATKKRRGRKAVKLKTLLQESLGDEDVVVDVWYEPIHGPCIEMQGYQGGWYYTTEEGGEDCLGHSFDEAVEMIGLNARLRAAMTGE